MSEDVVAYGLEDRNGEITSIRPTAKMSDSGIEKLEDSEAVPLVRKEDE